MRKHFALDFNASHTASVIITFTCIKVAVSLRNKEEILITKNLSETKRDIAAPYLMAQLNIQSICNRMKPGFDSIIAVTTPILS
mgnify:CR=1 FL=1